MNNTGKTKVYFNAISTETYMTWICEYILIMMKLQFGTFKIINFKRKTESVKIIIKYLHVLKISVLRMITKCTF